MKKRNRIAILVSSLVFAVIFIFNLFWVHYDTTRTGSAYDLPWDGGSSSVPKRNYGSETIPVNAPPGTEGQFAIEQKYEKISSISAESPDFDKDEKKLEDIALSEGIVVQSENRSGLAGERILSLTLGVVPERFEEVVAAISAIGKTVSFDVTKTDKTREYKALVASKQALEETLESLRALRNAGEGLSDLIELEMKILETEKDIRGHEVSLGDYSEGASLCTIIVSLSEARISIDTLWITIAAKAFGWTVLMFAGLAVSVLATAGAAALLAFAWSKIRDKAHPVS